MPFFDTHAHLFDDRFHGDLKAVVERAAAAGFTGILAVGIDLASSRVSVQEAVDYPIVSAAVGIQPNHVAEAQPTDWDQILELARAPGVVAIGETGLDRYWDRAPFDLQEEYFARHLALSREVGKPVVIHCRESEADVVRMLRNDFDTHGPVNGIMHSFTATAEVMEACVAMGLHISFAGMITYKNAADLRAVSQRVPADRLLIETDCPYLAPVPVRGQRNEPAYAIHTAECIAKERGYSIEELGKLTTATAQKLFSV